MKLYQKIKIDNEAEIRFLDIPVLQYEKTKINDKKKKIFSLFPKSLESKFFNKILAQIGKEYDHIWFMRVRAIGEAYLLNFIIDELITKHKAKNPCIVFYSKLQEDIFGLYSQIPYKFVNLNQQEVNTFLTKRRYKSSDATFHVYHCTIAEARQITKKFNDNTVQKSYPQIIKQLSGAKQFVKKNPDWSVETKLYVEEQIKTIGLNIDKFVFLVPEANGVVDISNEFWQDLTNKLEAKGYNIFVNTVNGETKYGKSLPFTISQSAYLASKSKGIVGLRCGFIELLSTFRMNKYILYTQHSSGHVSSENMKKYYTLAEYPFVDKNTIFEYDIEETDLKTITETILKGF